MARPFPLIMATLAASVLFSLACGAGREQGTLIAIDARSGKELWRARPPMAAVSPPVVDEGLVFVEGGDSCGSLEQETLVAYDAKTGEERWRSGAAGYCGGASVADGVAVVQDGPTLRGLDAETGHELWTSPLTSPLGPEAYQEVVPAAAGDIALVREGSEVRGFDRKSGAQRWAQVRSPPPLVGSTAFFGLGGLGKPCGVVAFDLVTGSERWRQTERQDGICSSAAGERLVVGCFFDTSQEKSKSATATLTAWGSDTGREVWEAAAESVCGEPGSPAVAVSENSVYVLAGIILAGIKGSSPTLQALDAASGVQRWQVDDSAERSPDEKAPRDAKAFAGQPSIGGASFGAATDEFVLLFAERTAIAFDARSGERLWEAAVPGPTRWAPTGAIGDGTIYLSAFGKPEEPPEGD